MSSERRVKKVDDKKSKDLLATRTLDNVFPEIKRYIFSRAGGLDVGCGPGTIIMGVEEVCRTVRAVREQIRVTRRDGWVLTGMGSFANQFFYPPCPSLFGIAIEYQHLGLNPATASEALAIFSQVSLKDLKIEGHVPPYRCVYSGSEFFNDRYEFFQSMMMQGAKKLVEMGKNTEDTRMEAKKEIEVWHQHPHALCIQTEVFVAGRV